MQLGAGVGELAGEIAVVGQQQQPLGVHVQAADGLDIGGNIEVVVDKRPAALVLATAELPLGFVVEDIAVFTLQGDGLAIHGDLIAGFDAAADLINDFVVNGDTAGGNPAVGFAP